MNDKIKSPHKFQVDEMVKYPTQDPTKVILVPTPPQTSKLEAIKRSQLERK